MDPLKNYLTMSAPFEFPLGSLSPTLQSLSSIDDDLGFASMIDLSNKDGTALTESKMKEGFNGSFFRQSSPSPHKKRRKSFPLSAEESLENTSASKMIDRTRESVYSSDYGESDREEGVIVLGQSQLDAQITLPVHPEPVSVQPPPVLSTKNTVRSGVVTEACTQYLKFIISDHRYKEFTSERCIDDIPVLEIRPYSKSDFAKGKMRHIYVHISGIDETMVVLQSRGYPLPKAKLTLMCSHDSTPLGLLVDKESLVKEEYSEKYIHKMGPYDLVTLETNLKLALSSDIVNRMNDISSCDTKYYIIVSLVWDSHECIEYFDQLYFIRSKRISKRSNKKND